MWEAIEKIFLYTLHNYPLFSSFCLVYVQGIREKYRYFSMFLSNLKKESNGFVSSLKIDWNFLCAIPFEKIKVWLHCFLCHAFAKKSQEIPIKEIKLAEERKNGILRTQKSAISRIENHAEDIRLSTLERFAASVGRKLEVKLS